LLIYIAAMAIIYRRAVSPNTHMLIEDNGDKPGERRLELYAAALAIIGFVVVWLGLS
jgi:hypothetical protein